MSSKKNSETVRVVFKIRKLCFKPATEEVRVIMSTRRNIADWTLKDTVKTEFIGLNEFFLESSLPRNKVMWYKLLVLRVKDREILHVEDFERKLRLGTSPVIVQLQYNEPGATMRKMRPWLTSAGSPANISVHTPKVGMFKPRPGGWDMTEDPCSEDRFYKAEYYPNGDTIFCKIKSPPKTKKPDFLDKKLGTYQSEMIQKANRKKDSEQQKSAKAPTKIPIYQRSGSKNQIYQSEMMEKANRKKGSKQQNPANAPTKIPIYQRSGSKKAAAQPRNSTLTPINNTIDTETVNDERGVIKDQCDEDKTEVTRGMGMEGDVDETEGTSDMGRDGDVAIDFSTRYDMRNARVLMPGQSCEVGCNFDIAIADDYTERGNHCHDSGDGLGEEKDTRTPFTSKRGLERPECKCTDYYWVEYPDLDRCICACNVNNHEDNVDKRDSEDGERADSVDRQGQEGVGIGFLKSCMRYAKPVALAGLAGGVLGAAGIYLWFKYKR